jgi:hypothetical protein
MHSLGPFHAFKELRMQVNISTLLESLSEGQGDLYVAKLSLPEPYHHSYQQQRLQRVYQPNHIQ